VKQQVKSGIAQTEFLDRLPRWASDHIRMLESNLKSAQLEREEVLSNKPTRTGLGYSFRQGAMGAPRIWLPDNEPIKFLFPDRNHPGDRFVQCSYEENRKQLKVMGSESFSVNPSSSNVVDITLRD